MPDAAPLPQKIGRYAVQRILARGTMGDVYMASTQDSRTGAPVYYAIKVLNPKLAKKLPFLARFKAEVKDDCLLEFREIEHDPKVMDYFVYDYLEVKPVSRATLKRERSPDILGLFASVAAALDKAHKKKYGHGNIKTSNFLIRRAKDDKGREVVQPILSDFGLTYIGPPESYAGDRLSRTLPYMAPERMEALFANDDKNTGITPASDVYALGAVLAETLSGVVPFGDARTIDDLRRFKRERKYLLLHVNNPVRRVDIRKLNDVLRRCLAPEPQGRYGSAAEFASELTACRVG